MTVDEVRQLLETAGLVLAEEKRLGNESGVQLRVSNGAVVNIYDKGTYYVQGQHKEQVDAILAGVYPCRCGQAMIYQETLDTTDFYRCPDNTKCQRVVFIGREGLDAGSETWYRQERIRGNRTAYPWWLHKAAAIRRRETP